MGQIDVFKSQKSLSLEHASYFLAKKDLLYTNKSSRPWLQNKKILVG